MPRSTIIAIALFIANTTVAAALLWHARPRTVASMPLEALSVAERTALLRLIDEEGVSPQRVRVCTERPCTRGPAVFLRDGVVRRLELPRSSRPGPLAGGER